MPPCRSQVPAPSASTCPCFGLALPILLTDDDTWNTLRVGIPNPGPSFRGALASRDFSLLFIGQLTAAMGNGAVQLALPWLVLKLTNSPLQLGLAYFFQFLPMLLFGVLGGVFADRWDRRMTMFVTDMVRAVAFISVGAIYYLDALAVEHLFAVIFLESTMANFFNPARAALMPNLVKEEDLRAANSLMEVSRHIGMLIFPSIGGLLVRVCGPCGDPLRRRRHVPAFSRHRVPHSLAARQGSHHRAGGVARPRRTHRRAANGRWAQVDRPRAPAAGCRCCWA